MTDRPTKLAIETDDATLVVRGEVDSHTSPQLQERLDAMDAGGTVTVDLAPTTFIDSSGLRVLVAAHKRLGRGGGRLVLRAPSEAVVRLLEVTGLDAELHVEA